ncbi:hypothetical protein NBRC10512v2_001477 [Rhodotorula toruloides]
MPSTASTSSHGPAPAPAPPPPDERMPLSSVPDLTKFFPPLIQDAICAEMNRGAEGAYYDEFEQLYWMYSGWDEGPAGLAILRQRHFARHPMLRPEQRLVSLPSLQSRRDLWAEAAETIRSSLYKLVGRPVVGI